MLSTPAVLDDGALARLRELDPSGASRLMERVLKAFLSSTDRLRIQADAARATDDRPALRLVAHTLKSSSASIGATRLAAVCAQIEATLRDASGADLSSLLAEFDAALASTLAAIGPMLKDLA